MTIRWYQDAIFYEVNVRAFRDSNGDGHGDLAGLTNKLDYLKWLGVDCIWLLPIYPSPLRDDGYDISDYYSVLSDLRHLDDFKALVEAAHARGMRVIADLVLNHTSDQHPWFQAARADPDFALPRLLRLERHRPEVHRCAHHLPRHRTLQLDLG